MRLLGLGEPAAPAAARRPMDIHMGQATVGKVGPATVWPTEFPQARPIQVDAKPGPLIPAYRALKKLGSREEKPPVEDYWGDVKPLFTVER